MVKDCMDLEYVNPLKLCFMLQTFIENIKCFGFIN